MELTKVDVRREVTGALEKILDYAQVAAPTPDVFKVLRSKILRASNDCIRNLEAKIEAMEGEDG